MEHPSEACSRMHEYPSVATSVILIRKYIWQRSSLDEKPFFLL